MITRWIAYGLFAVMVLLIGLSIPQFQRSRKAPYYILRQNALKRTTRYIIGAISTMILAIAFLVIPPMITNAPHPPSTTADSATPSPALTAAATPSATATPTPFPTLTPTPQPSPTAIESPLGDIPVPDIALTPLPSAVPAGNEVRITFTAVAMEKDENSLPIDPGETFPAGDHWLYLFFTYDGMENGVERTFAWYRDGEFFETCSQIDLWSWGTRGRTWYGCPTVWQPGEYEVYIFVEDQPVDHIAFEITE